MLIIFYCSSSSCLGSLDWFGGLQLAKGLTIMQKETLKKPFSFSFIFFKRKIIEYNLQSLGSKKLRAFHNLKIVKLPLLKHNFSVQNL